MDEQDVKARIFYFCREKFYNCMLNACEDGVNRFRGDICFNLYHALALVFCHQFEKGIQQLEAMKCESDYRLSVIIALMYSHRAMGTNEKELFHKLDSEARDYKRTAVYIDLYNTAYILFSFKKYEKAHDYIEKALAVEPSVPEILCLKGWIEMQLLKSDSTKRYKLSDVFEMSLKDNRRNLDSSLGLAESLLIEKNYDEAIAVLNKAIVRFPSLNLALVQKMKLYFTIQNWDQCIEILNRVTVMEPDNLEAFKINILISMCNFAKYEDATDAIQKYCVQLNKTEPKNVSLLIEDAQLFSRVCSRNELVLAETYRMIEKALETSINNATYMNELAYHCLLQGKLKEAVRFYKSVTKIDDSSLDALIGMTFCDLLENGKTEQIKHQVDFLVELQDIRKAPMLLYMQAKLSEKTDISLRFLNEICEQQLRTVQNIPYSSEYLLRLDPDFLLSISKEMMLYVPQSPELLTKDKFQQKPNSITKKVENILKVIVKACPALQEALYLLSKILFFNGDIIRAKSTLEQILNDSDVTFSDGYLLMAQIQVYTGQYERAAQNLEVGLSHDFKVRENPLYHFISGIIEKNHNNLDEAIKYFTSALQLAHTNLDSTDEDGNFNIQLAIADKASIYIELIDAHVQANQLHEASKLIETAVEEFRGTTEEARIMILNAEQAVSKKDIQNAISMLGKVQPNESYYLQAKTKLANIFLEHRRDTKAYLRCYQEMVDTDPGSESYILLGDAYLNILEIEKALGAYEKALETNPRDPYLTSKMGKALVKTHYYAKAINYYKDAIKLTENPELKLQLAELYMKLEQFDKAEALLTSEIENENAKTVEDIQTLKYKTKLMSILAEIYEKSGNTLGALKTLKNARDNQNRVIKRLSVEEADVSPEETNTLKDICIHLSKLAIALKDNEGAVIHYKEALSVFPNDTLILTDLAKLYMQMNNLELCQQTCSLLLKIDSDNEQASVMMADIAFRKVDFNMASFHFTHLLSKQPTNWKALVRFIEVLRRTGELDELPQYLQQAELSFGRVNKVAGFCYCTALYQWYSGNLNAALRNFNNARLDPEWGKKAICNMIEICLNPEDEMLGDQFFDGDDSEYRDSRSMALKTADRLLKELKQKSGGSDEENFKYRLLGNFLLLASKEKSNVERALEDFTSLASYDSYKEEIGPILGMATAHTMLKQQQRAKNQLKRVAKSVWTFEDAEHLERCWLLLADYYIQSSKYDLASELLKRILQHNKACTKAYEFSGFIAEKEQIYKDAANNYDCAWKFGGKSNPSIGYKLAFNFMKCKRYAEAIDVCQQVLRNHPDYPRMRKDILDKSLNNLRT